MLAARPRFRRDLSMLSTPDGCNGRFQLFRRNDCGRSLRNWSNDDRERISDFSFFFFLGQLRTKERAAKALLLVLSFFLSFFFFSLSLPLFFFFSNQTGQRGEAARPRSRRRYLGCQFQPRGGSSGERRKWRRRRPLLAAFVGLVGLVGVNDPRRAALRILFVSPRRRRCWFGCFGCCGSIADGAAAVLLLLLCSFSSDFDFDFCCRSSRNSRNRSGSSSSRGTRRAAAALPGLRRSRMLLRGS